MSSKVESKALLTVIVLDFNWQLKAFVQMTVTVLNDRREEDIQRHLLQPFW